ncbi:MAG: GGDEF domain-containing protein [Desulfosarcina sp.]|nr:GGDEF domain-containing protein [Desulfosarcina sp.]MBC2743518.1 GGDEF domain-containing protein [Desulfosarcina sp.]MBC2766427.1 GGDEF domain-containing protein [Desulfosarcina sp.]
MKNSGAFSEEIRQQIFNQFIAGETQKAAVLVRDGLKRVFSEIASAIRTTNQELSNSENNLETINDSLLPSLSEVDIERIVDQIKEEIKSLETSSGSFKEQLVQATNEIDQLKTKMEQYRTEAHKDPLTRIDNRRGLEKHMTKAISQAKETGAPMCLIMADIDYFKKINDTHGHLVGDNVLRMVAGTIKASIKGKDLVARIGGEEFAILLPDTPLEGAITLADNIRLTFERLDLKKKNTGESLGKITLSFGVTKYKKEETPEDFFQRADDALYQSKETGRNKVTSQ